MPAFGKVAKHELYIYGDTTPELRTVARLIVERATAARGSLVHNDPADLAIEPRNEDWREVRVLIWAVVTAFSNLLYL